MYIWSFEVLFLLMLLQSVFSLFRLKQIGKKVKEWKVVRGKLVQYEMLYGVIPGFTFLVKRNKEDPIGSECKFSASYVCNGGKYITNKLSLLDYVPFNSGNCTEKANVLVSDSKKNDGVIELLVDPNDPKSAVLDGSIDERWYTYYKLMMLLSVVLLSLPLWLL